MREHLQQSVGRFRIQADVGQSLALGCRVTLFLLDRKLRQFAGLGVWGAFFLAATALSISESSIGLTDRLALGLRKHATCLKNASPKVCP